MVFLREDQAQLSNEHNDPFRAKSEPLLEKRCHYNEARWCAADVSTGTFGYKGFKYILIIVQYIL